MNRTDGASRVRSLRAVSSSIAFWATAGLAAFFLGDAALRGAWDIVLLALPATLLVLWAVWLVLWRSSIRVGPERIVVVNLARVHDVPWARVDDITDRMQIALTLDDERTITCWGGPFPRKPGASRGASAGDDITESLRLLRSAAPASAEPLRSRWDWASIAAGVVLLGLVVAQMVALRI